SLDGRFIYYLADFPGAGRPNVLKRVPSHGGAESVLVESVSPFYWSVTHNGIYFLTLEQGRDYVDRYDPATGRTTRVGLLPFQAARLLRIHVGISRRPVSRSESCGSL